MKNFQKGSANVGLVVVIIILIVIAGYFAYMKNSITSTSVDQQKTSTDIPPQSSQTTIDKPVTSAVTSSSIKIISPNGGEVLRQDIAYSLKWNYTGLNTGDSLTIGFRGLNGNVCWAGKTTVSNKSYSFTPSKVKCTGSIASLSIGGQFKAQVIVDKYSTGKGVADLSDTYFTITVR